MITHLVIWFVFAPSLNKISFLDFPLGFYMAAQGSLIVFVVQLFVFAKQQDNIDRQFGVAED
jgi:putative solute:sodium symporter small subunit